MTFVLSVKLVPVTLFGSTTKKGPRREEKIDPKNNTFLRIILLRQSFIKSVFLLAQDQNRFHYLKVSSFGIGRFVHELS